MAEFLVFVGIIIVGGLVAIGISRSSNKDPEIGEVVQATWRMLANTNQLAFISNSRYRAFVTGNYRKCHFILKAIQKGQVQEVSEPLTHILVKPISYSVVKKFSLDEFPVGQRLSTTQVKKLLMPIPISETELGSISTIDWGNNLTYEHPHLISEEKLLQSLFDLLSELAHTYPKLLALGGEVVSALQELAIDKSNSFLLSIANQLIHDIADETTTRLKSKAPHLFCCNCLASCVPLEIHLSRRESIIYYGCRICGQSRQFLSSKLPLIVVLDSAMVDELEKREDGIYVNWLRRRRLFDFRQIEIIQASDEDVERFAVQIGNDTDEQRKVNYSQLPCIVSDQCYLSENTLWVLRQVLKKITIKTPSNPSS